MGIVLIGNVMKRLSFVWGLYIIHTRPHIAFGYYFTSVFHQPAFWDVLCGVRFSETTKLGLWAVRRGPSSCYQQRDRSKI